MRFMSKTMKFGAPPRVPGSRLVKPCDSMHDVGQAHTPLIEANDRRDFAARRAVRPWIRPSHPVRTDLPAEIASAALILTQTFEWKNAVKNVQVSNAGWVVAFLLFALLGWRWLQQANRDATAFTLVDAPKNHVESIEMATFDANDVSLNKILCDIAAEQFQKWSDGESGNDDHYHCEQGRRRK